MALAGVSIDEIERWRSLGWISFDVREIASLDSGGIAEITFVRNLARSGLSDLQINRLLSELPPPYRYDPVRTAYSFALGWVRQPVPLDELTLGEFVEESLDIWVEQRILLGELDVLRRVWARMAAALARAERAEGENEGGTS